MFFFDLIAGPCICLFSGFLEMLQGQGFVSLVIVSCVDFVLLYGKLYFAKTTFIVDCWRFVTAENSLVLPRDTYGIVFSAP